MIHPPCTMTARGRAASAHPRQYGTGPSGIDASAFDADFQRGCRSNRPAGADNQPKRRAVATPKHRRRCRTTPTATGSDGSTAGATTPPAQPKRHRSEPRPLRRRREHAQRRRRQRRRTAPQRVIPLANCAGLTSTRATGAARDGGSTSAAAPVLRTSVIDHRHGGIGRHERHSR